MEGRRLILNDAAVIENGQAGYADGVLCCFLPGHTIQEMAGLFFDPQKTQKIIFQYGEMSKEYDGFTFVTGMLQMENEAQIMLRKEE